MFDIILDIPKYIETLEETYLPFLDELDVFFNSISSVLPTSVLTMAFAVISATLLLRIFHGASGGGK